MILSCLYIISALSISGIAAYFSVLGLATIFPGSMGPIIIMGGVLEAGKIVAVIWLHRNWKTAPLLVKGYLTFAVLVLMGITSMGIFGFLSRAHIEHQTTTDKALAMAESINRKIERENTYVSRQAEYIKDLESRTSQSVSGIRIDIDQENARIADITAQMNTEISFEQNRADEASQKLEALDAELAELEQGPGGLFSNKKKKIEELKLAQSPLRSKLLLAIDEYNKNINSFREVAAESIQAIEDKKASFREKTETKDNNIQPRVEEHNQNIADAHSRIDQLELEKFEYSDNARNLEAEVGPVKYVAEMITDITGAEFSLSQAVRVVIIILVLVFDPLALLLVIAANISIVKHFPVSKKAKKNFKAELQNLEATKIALQEKKDELSLKENELLAAKEISDTVSEEIQKEISKLDKELQLKQQKSQELDDKVNSVSFSFEEKSTEYEDSINAQAAELAEIENKIKEVKLEHASQSEDLLSHKKQVEREKQDLFAEEASLDAQHAVVTAESLKAHDEQEKYKTKIKNLEDILTHMSREKQKAAEEKQTLEVKSSTLKENIATQQQLLKSLNKTYSDASRIDDVNEVFVKHEIDETVKFLPGGEHLISIRDAKSRIHQFIVPEEHVNLSHEYYHKVAEALEAVLDPEDLPFEYETEIAKYIRLRPPKYNCLT